MEAQHPAKVTERQVNQTGDKGFPHFKETGSRHAACLGFGSFFIID
jgi:hypothetical protein